MESYFKKIVEKLTAFPDPENPYGELEKLQMLYALETISYNLLTAFVILFIPFLIDTFQETLLLFCIFGLLRIIAGGFHFDHILKCITATSFIIITEGKASQIIQISLPVCLLLCLITNLLFFIHIPKGTENNPYSESYSQLQIKRLRFLSVFLTFFAVCFAQIRTIVLFAMLTVAIFLVPDLYRRFR